MTIKEIELATGLPRASVRFYESEGLISPTRGENGYRSYSQADLDSLLKIKLLRGLDIPLEDIKALQTDHRTLNSVLDAAVSRLEQDSARLGQALELCRTLRREQSSYSALNPRPYLQQMDAPSGSGKAEKFTYDRLPNATCPFRRFFARDLDTTIWAAAFLLFCQLVLRVNILSGHPALEIFRWFVPLALVLLTEPLMLHFFCTTPGKFLFGLKITRGDGSPLSLKEAFTRTWSVAIFGVGLYIPILSFIVMCIAWHRLRQGDTLSWDYGQDVAYWDSTRPDEHYWDYPKHVGKGALALLLYVCLLVLPGLAHRASARPIHHGDMTVAQFVENFNDFQRFKLRDGDSLNYILQKDGSFSKNVVPGGGFVFEVGSEPIPFTFHTDDEGTLTAITFEQHAEGEQLATIPYGRMSATLWSFLYGREGVDQKELARIHDEIGRGDYRLLSYGNPGSPASLSFTYDLPGAAVEFKLTCSGYLTAHAGMLMGQEGADCEYTMAFSLTLTD